MAVFTGPISMLLAIVLSLLQLCGGVPLTNFIEKGLDEGVVQETSVSITIGEDVKTFLETEVGSLEETGKIDSIELNTQSYLSVEDGVVYAKGSFDIAEDKDIAFELSVNRTGVTISKNVFEKMDSILSLISESPAFGSCYYDFEEENIIIPFSRSETKSFDEEYSNLKSVTPEMITDMIKSISEKANVPLILDVIKNSEFIKMSKAENSVILTGSMLDFVNFFGEVSEKCYNEIEAEEGFVSPGATELEENESTRAVLEASDVTLSFINENDSINFSADIAVRIPTKLAAEDYFEGDNITEEDRAAIELVKDFLLNHDKENIELIKVSYSTSFSVNKEKVEVLKDDMKEFNAKNKRQILYIQSQEAYEFATKETYANKSFSCVYEKSGIYEDGYTELSSSSVSFHDETGYTFENFALTGAEGYLIENRMYLPLRAICEATGHEVRWDGAEKKAYVSAKDGKEVYMEGVLINDRTYIKIRDFEKIGAIVEYAEYPEDDLTDTTCLIKVLF